MKLIISLILMMTAVVAFAAQQESKPELHRYAALTWNTNSYWIESTKGIVLIDGQLLRTDAKLLAAAIKATGKTVIAAILTHPHPDHMGGFTELRKQLGDFPIYGTQAMVEHAPKRYQEYLNNLAKQYGKASEPKLTLPNQLIKSKTRLELAGIILDILPQGAGEADDHLVIYLPQLNYLLTGDLTMHHHPAYVGEGRPFSLIARLKYLQNNYSNVKQVLSGHGDPMGPHVFQNNLDYLSTLIATVKQARVGLPPQQPLPEAQLKALVPALTDQFKHYSYYGFPAADITYWNLLGVQHGLLQQK